ncbi:MAG: permease-like cell division protein FtsX [Oscillospiraceae bacterium]|nr:permease-like cell division protein FtsX [Oscillospiraceae bacterium]
MRFSSFKYLLGQGWNNFSGKGNRLMSMASVGVVTSCLILVGICASLALNVNSFVQYLGAQNEVVVYMADTATESDIAEANAQLTADEEVSSFTYVSKEQALEEQMGYMGQYASLLSGYRGANNPLPASFRIHLEDLTKLEPASMRFSTMNGVDYVSTPTELASVLIALKNTTYYAGLAILLILFMVSMVVISNTIRLTVFARRREISIMKYVGATNSFIQFPFVVEGLIIGTVSACITFALLSGGYIYLYNYISTQASGFIAMLSMCMVPYESMWLVMLIGFFGFGWFIGGVGSALSMRKYLKV